MDAERVTRGCDACGQVDDHPRHSSMTVEDGQLAERMLHMDCCASAGCPDGSCDHILAGSGHARGAELISFLTGGVRG